MTTGFLVLAAVVVVAAAANVVAPAVVKVVHRRSFLTRIAASRAIHLTFDDGPDPHTTPLILDLLRDRGIKASFFVVGARAEAYPELLTQIHDEGHQIGSHGYSHLHAWKSTPWAISSDLHRGHQSVLKILDFEAHGDLLFRPPFGKLNLGSLRFLSRNTIWWNVDPRDYECTSGAQVFERLRHQMQPGSVILLHDGHMGEDSSPASTVEALTLILDYAEHNSSRVEALPA